MKVRVGHLFRRRRIVLLRSNEWLVYTSLLSENTNPQGLGDLHEGFDLCWEPEIKQDDTTWSNSAAAVSDDGVMTGRNVWPDSEVLPEFIAAVWAPPITGLTAPHGYTQDVCVIKLDKERFLPNFRGNAIDLGMC